MWKKSLRGWRTKGKHGGERKCNIINADTSFGTTNNATFTINTTAHHNNNNSNYNNNKVSKSGAAATGTEAGPGHIRELQNGLTGPGSLCRQYCYSCFGATHPQY